MCAFSSTACKFVIGLIKLLVSPNLQIALIGYWNIAKIHYWYITSAVYKRAGMVIYSWTGQYHKQSYTGGG